MRRTPLAALIVVIAASMVTVTACTNSSTGISLGTASRGSVQEVVDASATVTARAVASLTAPTAGSVASLAVRPGDPVAAGQVVAVIDSPAAQQQLREAGAALSAAKGGTVPVGSSANLTAVAKQTDAAAAKAFADARTAAGAIGDPAVRAAMLAQIDAAEQQYAALSATARSVVSATQKGVASLASAVSALGAAQRQQAQAAYDLAKSTVDALTLKAPIAGVVQFGGGSASSSGASLGDLLGSLDNGGTSGAATGSTGSAASGPGVDDAVVVGSQVGAGSPVALIVDTSALSLVAAVDETDIMLVTPGVTADVELDAAPDATYQATVRTVDVLPTTSSGGGVSYRVRLTLGTGSYSDGRAAPVPRPGMSAVTHLNVRQARDAVTVPAAAVFTVDGHDAVWLVRDGKASRARVGLGVQGQDTVQVVSGVSAGDQLVVKGTEKVHAGQALP